MIEDRAAVGLDTKLVARWYGLIFRAHVIEEPLEGSELPDQYVVLDEPAEVDGEPFAGRRFTSLSLAGAACRGGKHTNGWTFWSLDVGQFDSETGSRTKPSPKPTKPNRVSKAADHDAALAADSPAETVETAQTEEAEEPLLIG